MIGCPEGRFSDLVNKYGHYQNMPDPCILYEFNLIDTSCGTEFGNIIEGQIVDS